LEENEKQDGVMSAIFSLLSLYSMPIYAVMFTAILYVLKACTNLHIEVESFFIAFVFVAVVTMLNTLSFMIEITMSVLSELMKFVPRVVFRFSSKIMEILLVIWLVGKIDGAIGAVDLSMYGQITFGFTVHLITAWITSAKTSKTE
jgi:hypothetical protein